jgi:histidine triad (HIT) family protein
MATDCLFCKIVAGEIPANVIYQDDHVLAFEDINPQAPTHTLVIPREHIATLDELDEDKEAIAGKILVAARNIAREKGLDNRGYRLVANCLESAGQTVFHIHFHLLGGRSLGWPPG